jgi:hypothetical protein
MNRVRGRRARFVLGTAVLVLIAAACRPVAPPPPPPPPPQPVGQACVGSTPVTPTDYQSAFDHLRLTYTEWASADGSIPVDLPDGRTAWLFSDTYVGKVNSGGAIDPSDRLVRNSFVVQNGSCFAPVMGGAPLARSDLIPNPASNEWYWPASGIVDGSLLQVFLWHMQSTGSGSALAFNALGMSMATFSLPSLTLQGVTALPFTSSAHPYGATAMRGPGPDGTDVYLYGTNSRNDYVARAPLGQEDNPTAWVFWTGVAWLPSPAPAAPMHWTGVPPILPQLGSGEGPAAQPWVVPYGSEFLATSKSADAFSNDVSIYTAPTPAGPWTYAEQVADTSASDVQAYGAFLRNATSANPNVVYSVNTTFDSSPPPASIYNYGARFVPPSATLPPPPP